MPAPERHLASHVFNVIVLCAAAAGFAWMIHTTGLHTVRAMVSDIGWGFGGIIALDLAATCCDAGAIQAFMRPEARMVSYWRVVAAQASGRAVNIFIPGGAVGETTKVTMLVGHAPRARVVSAIVLFNLAALYLAVAVVAIGVPITLALVDLPHEIELTLWIALGVVVALMIGLGVLVHRGALGSALGAARGLHLISAERAERWHAKLSGIDDHLRELHFDRSPGTWLGFAFVLGSRVCSGLATTGVLALVGVPLHPTVVLGVLSVGVLIGWMSAIVPFGIGVADGSNYALFSVLGVSGAGGVAMTLFGRVRSLVVGVVGLGVMTIAHTINRVSIAQRNRRIRERLAAPGAAG